MRCLVVRLLRTGSLITDIVKYGTILSDKMRRMVVIVVINDK